METQKPQEQPQNTLDIMPEKGVVMLPEDDKEQFLSTCGKGYQLQKVWQIPRAVEEKHEVGFYQFKRAEK